MSARAVGGAVLFHGERTARKTHTCRDCFRLICRGERCQCKVLLSADPGHRGEVLVVRSCCREIR